MQHRDVVGDGADRGHVVGDGDRRRADLGDELADQIVDDPGHDRVEPGGRLVEEDHRGVGGDGAGEADALLHAAGELGRVEVGGLGAEADAASLAIARSRASARGRAAVRAWRRRKATFCQTVRLSKSAAALEEHAEVAEEGALVDRGQRLAVDQDLRRSRR